MIAEVEAGNASAVIVKDISRFGRDYLKVDFYTEVMFKEKGVRSFPNKRILRNNLCLPACKNY